MVYKMLGINTANKGKSAVASVGQAGSVAWACFVTFKNTRFGGWVSAFYFLGTPPAVSDFVTD
jgi:hypothetical protein